MRFVGPICVPCFEEFQRCMTRAGHMKANCYAAGTGWPLAGDVSCIALWIWLGWSGPGLGVCVVCQPGAFATMDLKWTVSDAQYQDNLMRYGNQYNRCAYSADPNECGCGPGNEDWRPDEERC
jgi:hypothetical protein